MIIKLKIRKKTPKYKGLILISLLTSILTYMVNNNVRFYGDDFFYKRFTSGGFLYFLARHRQHYFLANGRVIVHLLATCFLGLSPILWRIANSLMLGGIVYFGARTASIGNKNGAISAGAIFAASLGFLNISVTRQSVYWLTGSFNYVYPLLMLLIYWWFLSAEGEKSRVLPVFAFLSAATTEQVSLMTFGLTILYFLENMVFGKSKRKMIYAVCLTASVAGMLSVLCAPSVLYRASLENAHGTGFALIKYNVRNQVIVFMFSGIMAPYHLMAMLSAIGTIISAQRVKLKNKNGVLFLSVSTFLFWFWQVLPANIGSTAKAGRPALFLYLLTGLLYFVSLVYAAFVRYLEGKNAAPLYALLLCFGSQIMMVVSPVYGPRNLLCAIIMLALYTGFMMPPLNRIGIPAVFGVILCFLLSLPLLLPVFAAALLIKNKEAGARTAYIFISALALYVLLPTVGGYSENAKIFDRNIEAARRFNGGVLVQEKLKNENYGWVMPYHNPYYDPYYKSFLKIARNVKIEWINKGA